MTTYYVSLEYNEFGSGDTLTVGLSGDSILFYSTASTSPITEVVLGELDFVPVYAYNPTSSSVTITMSLAILTKTLVATLSLVGAIALFLF